MKILLAILILISLIPGKTYKFERMKVEEPKIDLAQKERDDLVWRIYGLESSYGRNDGCKKQGKYNGFGYAQHKSNWHCFETFEQASAAVHKWVEDKQKKGLNIAEILCLYNEGRIRNDCKYYQNYLVMK